MRISTGQMHLVAINSILEQQTKVARTQEQMSTGKRITSPSDDPSGTAALIGYQHSLDTVSQYQKNITVARQRLNREESALQSVGNILDRVRELALQANNSTMSNEDRRIIAVEVRQALDEFMAVANTRDANGEYIFAGYQGYTQPFSRNSAGEYVYNGDSGQRFLQIGATQQVATGDAGMDVFVRVPTGNGIFGMSGDPSNQGSGILSAGSVIDPSAYDGGVYTLTFPHLTPATGSLSFSDGIGTDDTLSYELSINGVNVYSVGEGGTPVSSLDDLAQQINDDSLSTGVRAIIDGGALYLVNTTPSNNPIVITESMSGASDGDNDSVTGYFGSILTGNSATSATQTYDMTEASHYVVEGGSGNIEASGEYVSGAQLMFKGIQTALSGAPMTGDVFTISPSGHQDIFSTIDNLARTLESGGAGANYSASLANSINGFLGDIDQGMENVRSVRAQVGARLSMLDSQGDMNEASRLLLDEARSNIQDLDYASAITQLSRHMVGLEAAQKSYLQIQGLSLFNYL